MRLPSATVVSHDLAGFDLAAQGAFQPASIETVEHRLVGWSSKPILDLLSANSQLFFSGNLYRLGLIGLAGIVLVELPKVTELFPLLLLNGNQTQPLLVGLAAVADFCLQLFIRPLEITQMLDALECQTLALRVGCKIIAASFAVIGAGIILAFTVLLMKRAIIG